MEIERGLVGISTDGGHSFDNINATSVGSGVSGWGAADGPALLSDGENSSIDNGLLVLQPGNMSWSSSFRTRYYWNGNVLRVTNESANATFSGLPKPATESKFVPYGNMIRFQGSSPVILPDNRILQTAIVCFGDNANSPSASSIVAFLSRDGGNHYSYLSTVADATLNLESMEGPNEHSVVLLKGSSHSPRLVIAMRFDGGDGHDSCLRNCSAEYKPYYWSTSDDLGRTWTPPSPMAGTGCARPRLLLVGGALLLAGGRLRYKTADGVGFSTDSDLWVADATAVATSSGSASPQWEVYAVSYLHNTLYDGAAGKPGLFTARVNSSATNRPETRSYNALVPIGGARIRDGSGPSLGPSEALLVDQAAGGLVANGTERGANCGGRAGQWCDYGFSMRITIA
jgi:hypothetical protein